MFIFNLWSVVLINSYLIGLGCGLKLRFLKAFQIILISSQERTTALRVWSGQWISSMSVPPQSQVNWGLVLGQTRQTCSGLWYFPPAGSSSASCRCNAVSLPWFLSGSHHQAIKRLHDLSSWGCNSTVIRIVFLLSLFFSCFVLLCIYLDSKYCESHTNKKLWLLLPNPHS